MDNNVTTECYVDTCMVRTILSSQRINHQYGCFNVAKRMQKELADRFALAIIDDDKSSIAYLQEFVEVKNHANEIKLYKHKNIQKYHYIIVISPAIEKFILTNAIRANVSLSQYDLPSDLKQLKAETKDISSINDVRFIRLFRKLKQEGSSNICKLAQWVEHLKAHPYNPHFDLL